MAKIITPRGKDGGALAPVSDQLPDFQREGDGQGSTDLLKQYVIPPRVKIVQGQAKKPFSDLFRPGDICLVPMVKPLWTAGFEPDGPNVAFHFVPILFYTEWVTWNPYGTDLPAIKARSFDPRGEIAVKSRDPERRKEPCVERPTLPDGRPAFISHNEHLNYIILLLGGGEFSDLPITVSFASGEHRAGTNFNTLVQTRKSKHLYGLQFAATVGKRENRQGTWYGIDVDNPQPDSGVTPYVMERERFDAYARIHAEYRAFRDQGVIQTQYDDEDTVEGAAAPPKAEERF